MTPYLETIAALDRAVWQIAHQTPAIDLFTRLNISGADNDGAENHWGLDHLLNTPRLLAEFFRAAPAPNNADCPPTPEEFAALPLATRADLIWRRLFIQQTPVSETRREVLTALGLLHLEPRQRDLPAYRRALGADNFPQRLRRIFTGANLLSVVVARNLFDTGELKTSTDFGTALNLDELLAAPEWANAREKLIARGYAAGAQLNKTSAAVVKNFLAAQSEKTRALYLSLSAGAEIDLTAKKNLAAKLLHKAILPLAEELCLPVALIDERRADFVALVERLVEEFPQNKLLALPADAPTAGAVNRLAASHANLLPIASAAGAANLRASARAALEIFGAEFALTGTGATVPEELLGQWAHRRWTLGKIWQKRYRELHRAGWLVTEEEIRRDVRAVLGGNFIRFVGAK